MSDTTSIEWCDHTWGPWEGCAKVSPGCLNCYAEARNHRFGNDNWGKGKPRRLTVDWKSPVRWNKRAGLPPESGDIEASIPMHMQRSILTRRPRVFPSLCDWLDDEVPIEWLARFLALIHDTPNIDWLLLTKRPENWSVLLHNAMRVIHDGTDEFISRWLDGDAPKNVWIGASVEDQQRADERIPDLLKIPARVRFLSVEPMLGPVHDLGWAFPQRDPVLLATMVTKPDEGVNWVIFGGESGPGARPCNVEWISQGMRQCKAAGVACFVKQLGSRPLVQISKEGLTQPFGLCHKKGGDPDEWPEDLRVREFPELT